MVEKDKIDFAKIMYGLAGNFGSEISKDDLSLRFEVLKKYTITQIKLSGLWLLKHREKTFPSNPTVKEFIEAIEKTTTNIKPLKLQAEEQCDIVLKYSNYYGRECDHVFKNNTTQHLMTHRWSFYKLGMMETKDLKWFRKEFVEAWVELESHDKLTQDILEIKDQHQIPAQNLKKIVDMKKI